MEPRLLAEVSTSPMTYERHHRVHGPLPSVRDRSALLEELARSGLRGRGGGAFPLVGKLEAVRRARRPSVLVVNGCEGEPMSAKDRVLLELLPHLVIDGAICCASLADARELFITIDESSSSAIDSVGRALRERVELRRADGNIHVVAVPFSYVAGQETSVVNFLGGGEAKPRVVPPRITDRGVAGRPTLMANAETLAHVALIARHGSDWYRRIGRDDDPGSSLVTLGGAIRYPGVYEIEHGATLGSVLHDAGGLTEAARAYLIGGYAGSWIDAGAAPRAALSNADLRALGASLGAGVVVALPQSACPVAETVRVAHWMAGESAGQCGPCSHGLAAISDTLAALREGSAGADAYRDLDRWAKLVTGRGACAHPDGAARMVTSALRVFAAEFDDHARYGICDACDRRPVLHTPAARPVPA
jgi:NADH:ubiquinone oxidoreductase subunit F (NADH-binding)